MRSVFYGLGWCHQFTVGEIFVFIYGIFIDAFSSSYLIVQELTSGRYVGRSEIVYIESKYLVLCIFICL